MESELMEWLVILIIVLIGVIIYLANKINTDKNNSVESELRHLGIEIAKGSDKLSMEKIEKYTELELMVEVSKMAIYMSDSKTNLVKAMNNNVTERIYDELSYKGYKYQDECFIIKPTDLFVIMRNHVDHEMRVYNQNPKNYIAAMRISSLGENY